MNFGAVFYLIPVGVPFADALSDLLASIARLMYQSGKQREHVNSEFMSVTVRTEFDHATLGSFGGILFTAEIDSESFHRVTRFFVPEARLSDSSNLVALPFLFARVMTRETEDTEYVN